MGTDATIAMVYNDVMMSIVFNATTSGDPFEHLVIRSNVDAMIELDPFGYRCDCPIGGAKQSIYVPFVLRYTSPEPRSHLEARARRLGKTGEDDALGVDVPFATCVCARINMMLHRHMSTSLECARMRTRVLGTACSGRRARLEALS